jgi:hypothetical protein
VTTNVALCPGLVFFYPCHTIVYRVVTLDALSVVAAAYRRIVIVVYRRFDLIRLSYPRLSSCSIFALVIISLALTEHTPRINASYSRMSKLSYALARKLTLGYYRRVWQGIQPWAHSRLGLGLTSSCSSSTSVSSTLVVYFEFCHSITMTSIPSPATSILDSRLLLSPGFRLRSRAIVSIVSVSASLSLTLALSRS